MAKKNAIVKNGVNKNDVVMTIPDDYSMEIDRSDIKIPSILLWQKMSDMPEFEGENVKAGMFVNPVTSDIYNGSFEGAIIRYYTTARIWGAKDKDGRKEVERYSRDGVHWDDDGSQIKPSEFGWTEDGSHAVKSYHYLVLPKGSTIPAMVTFKGSSAKFAKSLNANLMFMRPSWRSWFKFFSAQEEKNGNKYHVIQAKAQPKSMIDEDSASLALDLWTSTSQGVVSSPDMDKDHGKEEFDGDKVDY
tara:strand:- start:346 stop:1083 length:738 start_codon:yes stop_codon:yes gene_type:complete